MAHIVATVHLGWKDRKPHEDDCITRGVDVPRGADGKLHSPYAGLDEDKLRVLVEQRGCDMRTLGRAIRPFDLAREHLRRGEAYVAENSKRVKRLGGMNDFKGQLEDLAQRLPVWSWVAGVRGFGAFGLAQIVAETCTLSPDGLRHLSHYSGPAKAWKRMGLGLVKDAAGTWKRQQKTTDSDLAIKMGYVATRRAIMWNIGNALI